MKVFISYSHDSPQHADRVLALADRLISQGVECIVDQYEESPAEGWPLWMERHIETADYILVVCTETYNRRARRDEPAGVGRGVKWESVLIYQDLYDADSLNTKFIPVLFDPVDEQHIPRPLRGATHYLVDTDEGYEGLYRRLTQQPAKLRPEIGQVVPLPPSNRGQIPKDAQHVPKEREITTSGERNNMDAPQNSSGPQTDGKGEEGLPWYKRTAVIVALITAVVALTGTFVQLGLLGGGPPKVVPFRGRVSNLGGRGIGDAKVTLEGKGLPPLIYTDSEGVFTFNLPDDVKEIKIRVEASGYEMYNRRVDVAAKSELEDVRLGQKGDTTSELSGTVVDTADRPLQNARVTLDDIPGMAPVETSTDGVFNIRDIPKKYGDGVRVRVVMEGYQPNPYTEDRVLGAAPPIIKLRRIR